MPGLAPSAMCIRREAFYRVGPFDPQWQGREWVAWYVQAMERGLKTLMLPEVVALRRLHGDNKGRGQWTKADFTRILKASLDRRRAQ